MKTLVLAVLASGIASADPTSFQAPPGMRLVGPAASPPLETLAAAPPALAEEDLALLARDIGAMVDALRRMPSPGCSFPCDREGQPIVLPYLHCSAGEKPAGNS
jgi:hypothetical protein